METNGCNLAYPGHEVWDEEKTDIGWIGGGLTKRELFAAMALQGFISMNQPSEERGKEAPNIRAKAAVLCADALITELNKEQDNDQD